MDLPLKQYISQVLGFKALSIAGLGPTSWWEILEEFHDSVDVEVLVMSTAGGEGTNITCANHIVLLVSTTASYFVGA